MNLNAMMQQVVEQQVMNVASVVEDQLDEQLHKLENLDEDDLERIRQKRIDAMKAAQIKKQKWMQAGHGEVTDLQNEKDFFKVMKGEERMICHFYRNNWPCKVMDKHMSELASRHIETRFARIDAEKSPYLTEKLKIWMLPTLALIKNEKIIDYIVGLDDVGGSDDFKQEHLVMVLGAHGVINAEDGVAAGAPKPAGPTRNVRKGGVRAPDSDDETSDFSD
mmetsp:Transcript_36730/g.80015  ORF Transcript_36730/g.80015 Transcript_36730/m.80015 type:complete len:221 (-) Transcript_36730:60-722(-)|eukprot:CAMPEP_0118932968 /NCGR_PEP_ID=MMETSP1169-20130426/10822_1 /TAXON_ID=36882 /ORGANISM="Pyramimonas obovata, Strain CCMP722" /LENGTH=220 /DNA_ID=CAMNT_0006875677 /DNA_START=117 /DNA_END=779 /DNA_ORIENTATION=+